MRFGLVTTQFCNHLHSYALPCLVVIAVHVSLSVYTSLFVVVVRPIVLWLDLPMLLWIPRLY